MRSVLGRVVEKVEVQSSAPDHSTEILRVESNHTMDLHIGSTLNVDARRWFSSDDLPHSTLKW